MAGGLLLMAAAALALVLANLPATAEGYFAWTGFVVGPVVPHLGAMTVALWINDGLMALFFLLVGLEIKREVVGGRLADPGQRRLPVIAAVAGMAAPALVYTAVTATTPGLARGWAIPAATDIAFAIAVLALLGRRVPPSLILFLTTVAIVDDIGAVAVIALAYTAHIDGVALGGAAAVVALLVLLNRRGERPLPPYLAGFVLLWGLTILSGVHATVAGFIAALTIPVGEGGHRPLHRLERGLQPWVTYLVVPLFGFANAGVALDGVSLATLADRLVLGIALGLFIGKQAGIFGVVWLADRLGIAARPAGASWRQVHGVACIAGVGFTMSLFIGGLAFADPELVDRVKIGVIGGSLLSALVGCMLLRLAPEP